LGCFRNKNAKWLCNQVYSAIHSAQWMERRKKMPIAFFLQTFRLSLSSPGHHRLVVFSIRVPGKVRSHRRTSSSSMACSAFCSPEISEFRIQFFGQFFPRKKTKNGHSENQLCRMVLAIRPRSSVPACSWHSGRRHCLWNSRS
jgi:hypothetical protein